jgi:hypothetical protein
LAIYGFTSDQQGIRHALLEKGAPDVDETGTHRCLFGVRVLSDQQVSGRSGGWAAKVKVQDRKPRAGFARDHLYKDRS